MCGLAGILGTARPDHHALVSSMVSIQRHRGPDSFNVKQYPDAVLGHARLSIIDLSKNAKQPMESFDRRHVILFNGEIYNYLELRRELEDGYRFKSKSDTEVLLAAYQRWGDACLEHLNGMFAFCIFDQRTRRAFLARDRFGQKPLYYCQVGDCLYFASEIKALLAAGIVPRPNLEAWARYVKTAIYDDDNATFFEGIEQLRPGECARYSLSGGLQRSIYYALHERVEPYNLEFGKAAGKTRELMVDAVGLNMRSDVPVGVSLSGGLDSSALLTCIDLAGELHEEVTCVSAKFGADFSEAKWIEAAASHYNLPSHIENFSRQDFRDSIGPMIWHLEGPLGGLLNCAISSVMAKARRIGMTVMLDGCGLDEAFAGYRNFHNIYLADLLRRGDRKVSAAIRDYAKNWGVTEKDALAAAINQSSAGSTIDGTNPVKPGLLDSTFAARYEVPPVRPYVNTGNPMLDIQASYFQKLKIPRNTRMKDRVSMAFGVELRIPFFDHRLVEFALSLPYGYNFHDGHTKSVVRSAMADSMDDKVRLAPKRSINAPQGPWLTKEPMRSYVEELIQSSSFADRGIFDPEKVSEAFEDFRTGSYENSFFVWQWINVEEWFRTFIDKDAVAEHCPLCPDLAPTASPAHISAVCGVA
jgi:asparagine synthase (glutamine-hydrolysing)